MSKPAKPALANQQRKAELRTAARAYRRELSMRERADADSRICNRLQMLSVFAHAQNVAAYVAFDGEPSLQQLFHDSRNQKKRFLLPVIGSEHMTFAPRTDHRRMQLNRFGIAEPGARTAVPTRSIDIVLVPVVAFDSAGRRLGMGGGYYDRRFSFLLARKNYFRPRLIGVAYEAQKITTVPTNDWDVPLWGIVTEHQFHSFALEMQH